MSRRPPSKSSKRPDRSQVGPLGAILAVTCMVAAVACGNRLPSRFGTASPGAASVTTATTEPSSDGSADVQPGDLDGLVVLTGGALSIGSPAGALLAFHGPAVEAFSATMGRLIVQTAGPSFSIADVDQGRLSAPAWRDVDLPALDGRRVLSAPILSARGDRVAVETRAPARAIGFDILVIDLAGRGGGGGRVVARRAALAGAVAGAVGCRDRPAVGGVRSVVGVGGGWCAFGGRLVGR